MRIFLTMTALLFLVACAKQEDTLAIDCASQAAAIKGAALSIKKLNTVERNSIDAQINQSKGYCTGSVPANPAAASAAVRAGTASIAATIAVANLR